jgi:hypothetical protein
MSKEELLAAMQESELNYDVNLHLVQTPLTATYHTALQAATHPFVYALFPSLSYAAQLLEVGGQANNDRAMDILRVVIAQQDKDSSRSTYGIWPYFFEESLDAMDRPDWNMADFHGKKLVLILKRHANVLPQNLVEEIRNVVYHACQAIIIRNVGPHYTNIAIMGAFVTLVGGELLGDNTIQAYGWKRLQRFYDFTSGIGTFSEYNSPCYSPIAIDELDSIYQESVTPEAVILAEQLLDIAWHMIAKHYHPATGEWGGPYSRTYSTLMSNREKNFLGNAIRRDSLAIQCPEKYHGYFSSNDERYFCEPTTAEAGYQNYATTYQNERFSLGSYTVGSMWNQRRNLLGFVNADGNKVFVQLQFLKDGKDFCSAMYTGVQSRDTVLYSFNLALDNGAWHQELDLINGRFRASDLRIRLLIGGDLAELDLPTVQEGRRFVTQLGETQLQVESVFAEADYGALALTQERRDGELHLDYVIYAGEEQAFDFHALQKAVWVFALSLGGVGRLLEVDVRREGNSVTSTIGEGDARMSITVPLAPGKTLDFYQNNGVKLPKQLLAHMNGQSPALS